jgi:hypothetical protein
MQFAQFNQYLAATLQTYTKEIFEEEPIHIKHSSDVLICELVSSSQLAINKLHMLWRPQALLCSDQVP